LLFCVVRDQRASVGRFDERSERALPAQRRRSPRTETQRAPLSSALLQSIRLHSTSPSLPFAPRAPDAFEVNAPLAHALLTRKLRAKADWRQRFSSEPHLRATRECKGPQHFSGPRHGNPPRLCLLAAQAPARSRAAIPACRTSVFWPFAAGSADAQHESRRGVGEGRMLNRNSLSSMAAIPKRKP